MRDFKITRREAFKLSLAATGVGLASSRLLPDQAHAAIKPTDDQGIRFFRMNLGEAVVTVISDGWVELPSVKLLADNAQEDEFKAKLKEFFIKDGPIRLPLNAIVIENQGKTILIDSGTGNQFQPTLGRLPANLEHAGIDPAKIDKVLITHAHPDHIWGLTDPATKQGRYENAELSISETDWTFWTDENKLGAEGRLGLFVKGARKALLPWQARTQRIGAGKDMGAGITSLDSPGHTLGHLSYLVSSGKQTLLCLGDSVVGAHVSTARPDWHWGSDMDKELGVKTRIKLLDMAATDGILVHGYHFPFPGIGHIARQGQGYRFVPINPAWGL